MAAKAAIYNYTCKVSGVGTVLGRTVDKLGVAIYSIQKLSSIGGDFFRAKANGEFVVVHLAVTNLDSEQRTIDGDMFSLVRRDWTKFSSSDDGSTAWAMEYADDTNFYDYVDLNPEITLTGVVIFDVPTGSQLSNMSFTIESGDQSKPLPLRVMLK